MQRILTSGALKPLKAPQQFIRYSSSLDDFGTFGQHWIKQRRHAERMNGIYRNAALFICIPALIYGCYRAVASLNEEHERGRPEYIEYEFRNIRTKPFPWRDGNKPLFYNPRSDWVPGVGYEKDFDH